MTSANDKVVLALIGAGGRGTQVILGMQKCMPGVEVKYICEVDKERGGRVIEELEKQQKVRPQRIGDMRRAFDDNREIPDNQTITYDFGEFPMTVEASIYGEYLQKATPEVRYGNLFPDWPFLSDRIEIYGTEGMMYLGRHGSGWQVLGTDSKIIAQEYGYFPDEEHQKDFITCVRSRKKPNANIEQSHKSAILVHLANLSYRVGKKQLNFDSGSETVTNSEEANKITEGNYRKGFEIPRTV